MKLLPRELPSLITCILDPGADHVESGLTAGQHPVWQRAEVGGWGLMPGFSQKHLPFILFQTEQCKWKNCIRQCQFHPVKSLSNKYGSKFIKQLLRLPELAAFFSNNVHMCSRVYLLGQLSVLPHLGLILARWGPRGSCWYCFPGTSGSGHVEEWRPLMGPH